MKETKKESFITVLQLRNMGLLDFLEDYDPAKLPGCEPHRIITEGQRSYFMFHACKLVGAILDYELPPDADSADRINKRQDFIDACYYTLAIADSIKYGLDVGQLMDMFDYPLLYEKYIPESKSKERHINSSKKRIDRSYNEQAEAV